MSWLSYLNFAASITCFYFAAVVFFANRHDRRNQSIATLALSFAVHAFAYTFIAGLESPEHLMLWYRISAFGWIAMVPALVWMGISLGLPDRRIPPMIAVILGVWSIVLLIRQWTSTVLVFDFRQTAYGWQGVTDIRNVWGLLYTVSMYLAFVFDTYMIIRALRTRRLTVERRPLITILCCMTLFYLAGATTGLLLPALNVEFPNVSMIVFVITLIPLATLVYRRKYLQLDYRLITDEVIDSLSEIIIITQPDGTIVKMNLAGRQYFGIDRTEPGARISDFLTETGAIRAIEAMYRREAPIETFTYKPVGPRSNGYLMISIHPVSAARIELVAFVVTLSIERAYVDFLESYDLTRQEKLVSSLVLSEYTNREIADKLCISYGTVKNHVSKIFNKVGVSSRAEFVRTAKIK